MADIQPNKKTSEEDAAGALALTDLVRIVQGLGTDEAPYVSVRTTVEEITDFVIAANAAAFPIPDPTKVAISTQAGAHTFQPADAGKVVRHTSATAVVATIDTNANQAFALTQVVTGRQVGAGAVTITPATGVTLNVPAGLLAKTRAQGSDYMLHYVAADEWDLTGDLASA